MGSKAKEVGAALKRERQRSHPAAACPQPRLNHKTFRQAGVWLHRLRHADEGIEFFNAAGKTINLEVFFARDIVTLMNPAKVKNWPARILFTLGVMAMFVGALDPLEGSVVILIGSGLVALGTWLGHQERALCIYRTCLFGLIAFGVIALFGLSALGGLGGERGLSPWWGLLLPYPLGWLLGVANLVSRLIGRCRR